jgi:YD repeat-containing protein
MPGRVDQTRKEGSNGQTIHTDKTHDSRGLVLSASAPRFSSETEKRNIYTYDILGRQIRVDHPDGTFTTTTYNGGVLTITDERGNVRRTAM